MRLTDHAHVQPRTARLGKNHVSQQTGVSAPYPDARPGWGQSRHQRHRHRERSPACPSRSAH
ncbi:hypothetical protein FRAAL0112 [Frankia alni ACN14a]|uniref:Uncharacterized protein n=1 Tax=Frankia alni (strain DSM 45986 / CECT 9034 / ACN14a) TaxID=326424 RepID=Q0RUE8_FRAAA|nr:hypothetical protein FRAAL0112 [Frankia alni ACN14a]